MDILEVLKKSQQGDHNAFGTIYDLYATQIYKFIKYKISSQDDAEELLQIVFLKAWNGLPKLKLENLKFSAWLYSIARNTVNDFYRKQYRTIQTTSLSEEIDIGATSKEGIKFDGNSEIIKHALDSIPTQYKEVLELRFFQDLTIEETSIVMGRTNLAVRLLQHRALRQLENILKNYDI